MFEATGGDPQVCGKALANPLRQDPVHVAFGGLGFRLKRMPARTNAIQFW